MQLIEWLIKNRTAIDNYCVTFKNSELNSLLHVLLAEQIDEFKECGSDFEFVQSPLFQKIENNVLKNYTVSTYKVTDGFRIPKGAYIFSLNLGPITINTEKLLTELSGGITPPMSDSQFNLRKYIVLNYDIERMDKEPLNVINELYRKLGNILENNKEYEVFNNHTAFVRMYIPETK